ncbi:MAG: BlaI/MecI/CopY family transcriptional regulator [Bacteroidales bacterium]|jgi:predicted transcriptional regulator|nr:BlaI/MecI/CopY family transcriptional regulator [Bacteroidales bacterium]
MNKVLTKAEEQVMQTLWSIGRAGLREITEAMPEPKPHTSTVATILKILTDKEFIQAEPIGRMNFYSPTLSKEAYSGQRIKGIAHAYFDGSFSELISYMVKNKNVSIEDLELLLKQLKSNDKSLCIKPK